jgi:hypothetical protein
MDPREGRPGDCQAPNVRLPIALGDAEIEESRFAKLRDEGSASKINV